MMGVIQPTRYMHSQGLCNNTKLMVAYSDGATSSAIAGHAVSVTIKSLITSGKLWYIALFQTSQVRIAESSEQYRTDENWLQQTAWSGQRVHSAAAVVVVAVIESAVCRSFVDWPLWGARAPRCGAIRHIAFTVRRVIMIITLAAFWHWPAAEMTVGADSCRTWDHFVDTSLRRLTTWLSEWGNLMFPSLRQRFFPASHCYSQSNAQQPRKTPDLLLAWTPGTGVCAGTRNKSLIAKTIFFSATCKAMHNFLSYFLFQLACGWFLLP